MFTLHLSCEGQEEAALSFSRCKSGRSAHVPDTKPDGSSAPRQPHVRVLRAATASGERTELAEQLFCNIHLLKCF